jgi:ABC-type sugar transport system ATPase subunit
LSTETAKPMVGTPSTSGAETKVAPLLSVEQLSKTFPGQKALDETFLDLYPGEVHALLGTNGSGKSTLIKVLTGVYLSDPGAVVSAGGVSEELIRGAVTGDINGVPVRCVHQDLGLVDSLSVMDNIALTDGFQSTGGKISWRRQAKRARTLLARLDAEDLDVRAPVASITPVERTKVAIARVLGSWGDSTGLLILDEPTATLGDEEVEQLFAVIREIRAAGHAVLYVSHRLAEVFELADRVTVLRQARVVHTGMTSELDRKSLVTHMLGHELKEYEHGSRAEKKIGETERLGVEGFSSSIVRELAFSVHEGEIIGFAGLAGSGQEEVPPALMGAVPAEGTLRTAGRTIPLFRMNPAKAGDYGLAYVPPDRKRQGIVAGWPVRENTTLSIFDRFRRGGIFLGQRAMTSEASTWADRVNLEPRDPMKPIQLLSGGNQNKVLVARCLATQPQVLLLSEPTAGVDVGAREQIWQLIRAAASDGLSVVMSSTDTSDLAALCDRVLVMRQGIVYEELIGDDVNDRRISQSVIASHS